jgi:pullulanase
VYEQFGFGLTGNGDQRFQLFIPDVDIDTFQYVRGGPSNIERVRVVGNFLSSFAAGKRDWNPDDGLDLIAKPHPNGVLYEVVLANALAPGYYEYKYYVDFTTQKGRWVSDPCAKISGRSSGNSAFVVGGSPLQDVAPMLGVDLSELAIYEIMVDDFTRGYRGDRAPLDALVDRLDYVRSLGVNSIELMPCTARPDNEAFSWGYDPTQFFAIENDYVEDPNTPLDRRVRLQRVVQESHARELRCLLDIVLQHAKCDSPDAGFAYCFLWETTTDSPFIGVFVPGNAFGSLPLDYNNLCALQFSYDVCMYWLETFGLDGLRFDQTSGFFRSEDVGQGLPAILELVRRKRLKDRVAPALTALEDTWDYGAIDRTNAAKASGCWLDPYRQTVAQSASSGPMTQMMRALNAHLDFAVNANPVIYLENHDHSGVAQVAGGRASWFRTQPSAIALFTSPGAVLLRNGQEFGWDVLLWDDDTNAPPQFKRVQPRTVPLDLADDAIGRSVRALYGTLSVLRASHAALRGPNFHPSSYDETLGAFDSMGYGVDVNRKLVIFHRWGGGDGGVERFMVVLNFGPGDQYVDVPLPVDGAWSDLLGGRGVDAIQGWARQVQVGSNWGKVLFRVG